LSPPISKETLEGLIGRVSIVGGKVVGVRFTPTLLESGDRSHVATGGSGARIMNRLWAIRRARRW
jgi:hypothetical protein